MKQHHTLKQTRESNESIKLKIDRKEVQLNVLLRDIRILKASLRGR